MVPSSSLSLFIIWGSALIAICFGQVDRITPQDPVGDNETIVSVGGSFTLGFFTPGNSTNRYVGIWYTNIPGPTIVWVANRENPVPDSSGSFSIAGDGNLVVLDGRNSTLWSSNVSGPAVADRDVVAVLSPSGNLVLRYRNDTVLWESFDYPSDTFLPGMRMRLNLTTQATWRVRSWKDANDPAVGEYSLGIDVQGPLAELVMWRGTDRFWRSGVVWNGDMFSGLTENPGFVSYITLLSRDQEVYVTIAVSDDSVQTRFILTPNGRVQQLLWLERNRTWEPLYWSHSKECFSYNYCGQFSSCNISGPGTDCDCLRGYVPRNQAEWSRRNYTSGCVKREESVCGRGEGFFRQTQTTFPDLPRVVGRSSLAECEARCLRNCSCVAYAFANVTWADSTCLIWERSLIDMQAFYPRGQAFFLRLDSSELETSDLGSGSSNRRNVLVIVLVTVGAFVCIVAIFIYCLWRRMNRPGSRDEQYLMPVANASYSGDPIASEVPLFQFKMIVTATNNFDSANKLGEGGFGPVYKGKLEGQDVAVKRLSESSGQGLIEMRNEVELIAKLQHKNLVRLLGWCIHGEEKMLIYEYLPNNSLDQILFDPQKKAVLKWKLRFSIIDGIAQGLLYLHRYSRLKIIHRDLKASNILLDAEMNPKISDFGMARIFGGSRTEESTKRVVGTFGYMAPEYAMEGHFSEKSDVYSFGVLLIEIISGQKNTGFFNPTQSTRLIANAWNLWNEGRELELMDPVCQESFDSQQVIKCINVGLLCVQDDPNERPTMNTVISMFSSESTNLPKPAIPVFSNRSSVTFMSSSSSIVNSNSLNQVTISTLAPR